MALTSIVPNIRVAAPRDPQQLRELFREALTVKDGPTVVRFPKGNVGENRAAIKRLPGGVDILREPSSTAQNDESDQTVDVLIVAVGVFADSALRVAERLESDNVRVTLVDPRWVVPVSPDILELAVESDLVVVYEDGIVHGGVGSAIAEALSYAEIDTPLRHIAFPQVFPEHASREQIFEEFGMDESAATKKIREWVRGLEDHDQ